MAKIGIGVTTRNRPEILELALKHFKEYMPKNHRIDFFIYDDASDPYEFDKYLSMAFTSSSLYRWCFSPERKGVAKAKNECLKALKNNDYIFLFDDDCFPIFHGWVDKFIEASNKHKVSHILHIEARPECQPINDHGDIIEFRDAAGVMLFITKEVIDKVGGFNKDFGTWGYEHLEYSRRIHQAGMNGEYGKYLALKDSKKYIYSIDISNSVYFGNRDDFRQPPLGRITSFRSSTNDNEKSQNMQMYAGLFNSNTPIYQEL